MRILYNICNWLVFESGYLALGAIYRMLAGYFGVSTHTDHAQGGLDAYMAWSFAMSIFGSVLSLWLVMGSLVSQEAVQNLRHFRLADAQCQSDEDREALLAVIADFFTDAYSGETDQDRLRKVGWHRFESATDSRNRVSKLRAPEAVTR